MPAEIKLMKINLDQAVAPEFNLLEAIRRQSLRIQLAQQQQEPAVEPSASVAPALATPKPLSSAPIQGELTARERFLKSFRLALAVSPNVEHESAPQPLQVSAPAPARLSTLERLQAAQAKQGNSLNSTFDFPENDDSGRNTSRSRSSTFNSAVPLEVVEGRLATIKEFNGWGIGTIATEDRLEVRVKGESLIGLKEGLEYALSGRYTEHATHGLSFDVVSVVPAISLNLKAIEHYLVKTFSGIGPVKANKYVVQVERDGGQDALVQLRETLLNKPWELDLTKISKDAKFANGMESASALKQQLVYRNLLLTLGSRGALRDAVAKLLAAYLYQAVQPVQKGPAIPGAKMDEGPADIVTATWAELMRNPYSPIKEVPGYGFGLAEQIAAVANIPKDSPFRLGALVEHATTEGCRSRGHSFLGTSEFVAAIRKVDPSAPAQKALTFAIEQKLVIIDGKRVYPHRIHAAEKDVASAIAKLLLPAEPLTKRTPAEVRTKLAKNPESINVTFKDGFDKDQVDAIAGLMTGRQRLHVLTGGPGTGKTAIMEVLLSLLGRKTFAFCAPTGRAAKILTGRVKPFGYAASTVNSLLRGAEDVGFEVNAAEPLCCDVLVVDENTMNGIVMAAAILAALPEHAHLIVLGDPGLPAKSDVPNSARAGQLASISPGRFMQDLLLMPNVQHAHLTKTYRNSGGILEVVQEVAIGALKTTDRKAVIFSETLPEPEVGLPLVISEYLGRVAADGIENTFLIMPKRKGEKDQPGWNTTYVNHELRKVCNPYGEKLPGSTLHLGDRIMIRSNMKITQPNSADLGQTVTLSGWTPPSLALQRAKPINDSTSKNDSAVESIASGSSDEEGPRIQVVNGDTGTLVAYSMANNDRRLGAPKWAMLALDDGQIVQFPGSELGALDHSYAGTVHSAQGSEYKNVIMVVTPGSAEFMNAPIIFTGFSRARDSLSVWGDNAVIRKIAATPMPERNSGLLERVKDILTEVNADQDENENVEDQANNFDR